MSLNRVTLVGRLVADPELKYTPQGVAVAQLRIAVNRVTKNEAGEYESDFFNMVAWRRSAEFASTYLKKGRLISVDGRLRTRSWVDQATGQKRSVVEIEAENLEGLDRRGDVESGEGEASAHAADGNGSASGGESYTPAPAARRPAATATPRQATPVAADDDLDESDPFADE